MATIYRIHNDQVRPYRATELTVWGPRGYVFEPETAEVLERHGTWATVERYQTDRQDVAQYLRGARREGWPIEVIRHAWGRA